MNFPTTTGIKRQDNCLPVPPATVKRKPATTAKGKPATTVKRKPATTAKRKPATTAKGKSKRIIPAKITDYITYTQSSTGRDALYSAKLNSLLRNPIDLTATDRRKIAKLINFKQLYVIVREDFVSNHSETKDKIKYLSDNTPMFIKGVSIVKYINDPQKIKSNKAVKNKKRIQKKSEKTANENLEIDKKEIAVSQKTTRAEREEPKTLFGDFMQNVFGK